jgi:hypothetical protein
MESERGTTGEAGASTAKELSESLEKAFGLASSDE